LLDQIDQPRHRDLLELGTDRVFGVSIISCLEIAKLVELES